MVVQGCGIQGVGVNPDLVEGHFLLGGIHLFHKDYLAAERSFQRAVALKPTHAIAYFNLAESRLKQGNQPGAMEACNSSAEASSAHTNAGASM